MLITKLFINILSIDLFILNLIKLLWNLGANLF